MVFSIVPLSIVVLAPISTSSPISTEPREGILNTFTSVFVSLIAPCSLACSMLLGASVTKENPSAPKLTPWCKIQREPTFTLSPTLTDG